MAQEEPAPHIAWAWAFSEAVRPFSAGAEYVNFLADEGAARVKAAYGPDIYAALPGSRNSTIRTTCSGSTRTSCRQPDILRYCQRIFLSQGASTMLVALLLGQVRHGQDTVDMAHRAVE